MGSPRFWPSVIPVAVATVLFASFSSAQNVCDDIQNNDAVEIAFNESSTVPEFNDPNYIRIIETENVFSIVIGSNTGNSSLQFDDKFRIGYSSILGGYFVQMVGAIDRDGPTASLVDDVNILQYSIECQAQRDGKIVYGILRILIHDVNDNPPVFLNSSLYTSVVELTPPSVIYRGVSTTDRDEGNNRNPTYSLQSKPGALFNGNNLFNINPNTGDVSIRNILDFDSMYESVGGDASKVRYELVITATDGGFPPLSNSANLTISITDTDDQRPRFYDPSCLVNNDFICFDPQYVSQIISDDTSGSTLTIFSVSRVTGDEEEVEILAHDGDTLNASIECSINAAIPDGFGSYFEVSTSHVRNTNLYRCNVHHLPDMPISRQMQSSIQLIIQVQEQSFNFLSAFTYLTIEVLENETFSTTSPDPTEDQFVISPVNATGYVNENAFVGTQVSGDRDLSFDLEFFFDQSSADRSDVGTDFLITQAPTSPFIVTEDGYVVVSRPVLDFESRQSYKFTVSITKLSTSMTANASVTIFVLDLNDNAPVFDSSVNYTFAVQEDDYSLAEKRIFRFSATDRDGSPENNRVTFALDSVSPADGNGKFKLTQNGGLFVTGVVTAGDYYEFLVAAYDNGTPPLRSEILVVVDVNEAGTASSDDGLGTGVLVGIAVAAILIVALVIILITCYMCRRKQNKSQDGNRYNENARLAREGNLNLHGTTAPKHNIAYVKDQPYAYADGFIHKDSSNQKQPTSEYNTVNDLQEEEEEIYDHIDDTVIQPDGVSENSYEQPRNLLQEDDASYLAPELPKRGNSNDDSSYLEPIGLGMGSGGDSSPVPSHPDPSETSIATGNDVKPGESTEGTNERTENGPDPIGDEAHKNQRTDGDKSDQKTYYDTLIPDDPNYSNLNRDPRDYFGIHKDAEMTSL